MSDQWAAGETIMAPKLNAASTPIGSIQMLAYVPSTPLTGYLYCNGDAVSRSTYAALFAVIGTTYGSGDNSTTFNLPDFRGVFLRGLDDGKGYDSGRTMGTYQDDDNKAHTHGGVFRSGTDYAISGTPSNAGLGSTNSQGTEARPKNFPVYYVIRY